MLYIGLAAQPTSARQANLVRELSGSSSGLAAEKSYDLVEALDLGRLNDATYRAALAEHDVNLETANQTISGYLPQASYTYQNIPTESGSRHVATITQPIFSLGGLATLKQRNPRRLYADETLKVREQDLVLRIATAATDLIKAREATRLNDARITAFRTQSERAERLYRSGFGTVTDARDIEVRYEQALANRLLLQSDQIAAEARMRSITGATPSSTSFGVPAKFGSLELRGRGTFEDAQAQSNPQIEAARQNERISKLEADRARGGLFPIVGASATYSNRDGVADTFVGLTVNAPLNAGSVFQTRAANATARRALEERRQVEERAGTELERLYALVDGGRSALVISAKAIDAAELSVLANSKSFEGGVRSNVDVVNAIQILFEVKNDYVQSATALALNYLNLLLLAGENPRDALAATQAFLLRP